MSQVGMLNDLEFLVKMLCQERVYNGETVVSFTEKELKLGINYLMRVRDAHVGAKISEEEKYAVNAILEDFNYSELGRKTKATFGAVVMSEYDHKRNEIILPKRVLGYKEVLEESDCVQILFMLYLRGYGYKKIYEEIKYDERLKASMEYLKGDYYIDVKRKGVKYEAETSERELCGLLAVDFMVENLALKKAFKIAKSEGYKISLKDMKKMELIHMAAKFIQIQEMISNERLVILNDFVFKIN